MGSSRDMEEKQLYFQFKGSLRAASLFRDIQENTPVLELDLCLNILSQWNLVI